jgi:hypothetical protein
VGQAAQRNNPGLTRPRWFLDCRSIISGLPRDYVLTIHRKVLYFGGIKSFSYALQSPAGGAF